MLLRGARGTLLHGRRRAGVQAVVQFREVIESVGKAVDAGGVAVMVVGVAITAAEFVRERREPDAYARARHRLGRAILLGLEVLVAGDIIRTVAASPTFASVGVLAAIVLIRTFLSFTLEMEVSGRWPWQQRAETAPRD
jgi:uncharacterized membrane protein